MHRSRRARRLAIPTALALGLAPVLLVGVPAHAVVIPVMTEAELIAAIATADGDAAQDVISIGADITLGAALPQIDEDVVIEGNGRTITAGGHDVFDLDTADVEIVDLVILSPGIGIAVNGGSLLAENVEIVDAAADGIEVDDADLDLRAVTITGSGANGLEVFNDEGGMSISITGPSVFSGAGQWGVWIYQPISANVTMSGATVASNGEDGMELQVGGASELSLSDITAEDNGSNGIDVGVGDTSVATLDQISASGGHAVAGITVGASEQATITMSATDGDDNDGHGGIAIVNEQATIVSTGSSPTGNDFAGWFLSARGPDSTLDFRVVLASLNGAAGITLDPRADGHIEVTDSLIQGGGVGIDVAPPPIFDPNPGNGGSATIRGTEIAGSDQHGIFISSLASGVDLAFVDSTIHGVDGSSDGAAVQAQLVDATLTIERSTIYDNASSEPAGGILAYGDDTGALRIVDSTLTGNSSTVFASALRAQGLASVDILNSTIVDNLPTNDTSVLIEDVLATTIRNTVIDGGDQALSVSAPETTLDADYNLVGSADGGTAAALAAGTGNIPGSPDPMLGALADNGGPTPTMLPLLGSPLLDAGDPAFTAPPATDQRLQNRVSNDRIDIGAVEVQVADPAELPDTGATTSWLIPVAIGLLVLGAIALVVTLVVRRRKQT